jgi:hypothetical protein
MSILSGFGLDPAHASRPRQAVRACGIPRYDLLNMSLDELISALDAEDLEQARMMSPSQKLRAGGDLFDDACRWTLAGIRDQHPDFTPEQAMDELRRRVEMASAAEDNLE